MKGNIHKRITFEDKFGRRYSCEHRRLARLRTEKRQQKKTMRKWLKEN